jgi:hypothetical protein
MKNQRFDRETISEQPELEIVLTPSESLLISYDQWKGSGKLKSEPMLSHMKAMILKEFPWHLVDYLKTYSPEEVQ